MPSYGVLRQVALVRTDVLEECRSSVIRVARISAPGTTLAVTSNRCTLQRNIMYFFASCVGWQLQLTLFLVHWFMPPWWRRFYVPPKCRFLWEPHAITTQKMSYFIVTAMTTSDLTRILLFEGQLVLLSTCCSSELTEWILVDLRFLGATQFTCSLCWSCVHKTQIKLNCLSGEGGTFFKIMILWSRIHYAFKLWNFYFNSFLIENIEICTMTIISSSIQCVICLRSCRFEPIINENEEQWQWMVFWSSKCFTRTDLNMLLYKCQTGSHEQHFFIK
jgi:hypothetical protein